MAQIDIDNAIAAFIDYVTNTPNLTAADILERYRSISNGLKP